MDILDLLPPDEPTVQGLKLYQKHFTNARELIITLRASDPEKAAGWAKALALHLLQETNLFEGVSWQPPWMEDPSQLAELLGCVWLNQPPDAFGALTNRLAANRLALGLGCRENGRCFPLSELYLIILHGRGKVRRRLLVFGEQPL